jgi:hypothetical protein
MDFDGDGAGVSLAHGVRRVGAECRYHDDDGSGDPCDGGGDQQPVL